MSRWLSRSHLTPADFLNLHELDLLLQVVVDPAFMSDPFERDLVSKQVSFQILETLQVLRDDPGQEEVQLVETAKYLSVDQMISTSDITDQGSEEVEKLWSLVRVDLVQSPSDASEDVHSLVSCWLLVVESKVQFDHLVLDVLEVVRHHRHRLDSVEVSSEKLHVVLDVV